MFLLSLCLSATAPGLLLELAAKQLSRYIYVVDRESPILHVQTASINRQSGLGHAIFFSSQDDASLFNISHPHCIGDAPYTLSFISAPKFLLVQSCDSTGQGAFYAVQDLINSALNVFFTAEGAILPVTPVYSPAYAVFAAASDLASSSGGFVAAAPVFPQRGFQPWGSYPIGNDWWDDDEYRRVVELVVNLKGNWIGMHSYPCNYPWPEPGVWVGSGGDAEYILPSGNITPPAIMGKCSSSWASTERGSWGLTPFPASTLNYGIASLFEMDCWGNRAITKEGEGVCPSPLDNVSNAKMFNAVGYLYKSVFAYSASLGVSTALGTEAPLQTGAPTPSPSLPLKTWWSPGREDTFVTPTDCAECPPSGDPMAYTRIPTETSAFLFSETTAVLLPGISQHSPYPVAHYHHYPHTIFRRPWPGACSFGLLLQWRSNL